MVLEHARAEAAAFAHVLHELVALLRRGAFVADEAGREFAARLRRHALDLLDGRTHALQALGREFQDLADGLDLFDGRVAFGRTRTGRLGGNDDGPEEEQQTEGDAGHGQEPEATKVSTTTARSVTGASNERSSAAPKRSAS